MSEEQKKYNLTKGTIEQFYTSAKKEDFRGDTVDCGGPPPVPSIIGGVSLACGSFEFKANGVAGLIGVAAAGGSMWLATYGLYKFMTRVENPQQLVSDVVNAVANNPDAAVERIEEGSLIFRVFVSGMEKILKMLEDFNSGKLLQALQDAMSAHCKEGEGVELESLEVGGGRMLKASRSQVAEIKRESERALNGKIDISQHKIVLSTHPVLSMPGKDIPMLRGVQQGSVDIPAILKFAAEGNFVDDEWTMLQPMPFN